MVERLFLAVPRGCLRFVIVVFPDYTHLLFRQKPVILEIKPQELVWVAIDKNDKTEAYFVFYGPLLPLLRFDCIHVRIQRGDRGSGPPEKSQKYRVS